MTSNSGISITGGTVNAGAMAAGDHAKATTTTTHQVSAASLEELRNEMAALVDAIRASAARLADGEQAVTVAEDAQRELAKPAPDKHTLLATLQKLASGVGSIGSLATAVAAIEHAAATLF
jgi:hypothetical protein